MIVLFLIIHLLSYQAAATSNGPSNNLQHCTIPYRFEKSMTMGNRAWIASNNLETGQDIVCSHMTTSDGLRMCACVCQTNMKGMSNGNNDIKWTVPKYKKCSNPEDAKDNRLYCYDLATTDQNRKCSCTCSTVKAGFPFAYQENGMVFIELDEKKDFSNDDLIGHENHAGPIFMSAQHEDDLLPNIVFEESEETSGNLVKDLKNKKESTNIPNIYMYIKNSSMSSNENGPSKNYLKTTAEESVSTKLTPVYIAEPLKSSDKKSESLILKSEATKKPTEEMSLDIDPMLESPKIIDEGPYVVYVTTEQATDIPTEQPTNNLKSKDGLSNSLEVKHNENNESRKLVPEIKKEVLIMIVKSDVEDSKESLPAQNTNTMPLLVMNSDGQGNNLSGPLTTNVANENNTTQENTYQTKQPRLIYLSDAIKHHENGAELNLDSADSLNSNPTKETTHDDNIVVIYPKNNRIHTKTDVGIMKQKPQHSHINSRATKSDEKVVYVYSQAVTESSQTMDSSATMRKINKEVNMSSDDEWKIISKKSSVSSSTGSKLKSIESSPNTLLSVEKTEGSPVLISLYPVLDNSSMEVVKPRENIVLIQDSEPNNEVLSSGERSIEQLKESSNDAEDYIEDESVTIAYSGKVFQSVPAEGSPRSESVPLNMPSALMPAYKSDSTLSDPNPSLIPETLLPSSTLTASSSPSTTDISIPVPPPTASSRIVVTTDTSSIPSELISTSSAPTLPEMLASTPLSLLRSSTIKEAVPTEPSSTASIITTPKGIKTTTHSLLEEVGATMKLSLQEELKLKRQNQFMEFLRKKSQDSNKHRLTATSLKRPSSTHVPVTEIRKMLLDAAQRRNALLKGRDRAKTQATEVEHSTISHEKIEDSQQNDDDIPSLSTTTTPRTMNARRGGILQRRPLQVRTTKSPMEVEQ